MSSAPPPPARPAAAAPAAGSAGAATAPGSTPSAPANAAASAAESPRKQALESAPEGTSASHAIVSAQALVKTFAAPGGGQVRALDGISLSARAGQLTALVGPDGAGKTTLMRLMAGLLKPDGGHLHVLGTDVAAQPQAVQDRISYMPQRFGLYEDLSVQENMDLYADLHGVPHAVRRERFARLLAMTDLARFTARPAGKLSGGMKQKLGLACTLVRSPDLLLLDEPSVGVDPLSRRDLWRIVLQLVQAERLSVIVSTAYMDEAERCAQVFVMHHGQLLAQGTPEALRQRASGLCHSAQPPVGMPARQLQARLMDARALIIDAVPAGGAVRYICQPQASAAAMAALLGPAPSQPRPAELEDAFMMLLRQHQDASGASASASSARNASTPGAAGAPLASGASPAASAQAAKAADAATPAPHPATPTAASAAIPAASKNIAATPHQTCEDGIFSSPPPAVPASHTCAAAHPRPAAPAPCPGTAASAPNAAASTATAHASLSAAPTGAGSPTAPAADQAPAQAPQPATPAAASAAAPAPSKNIAATPHQPCEDGIFYSPPPAAPASHACAAAHPRPAAPAPCPGTAASAPSAAAQAPVIVVRDLVRRFGDFTAVASTSFEVARGEIFGLLGPNGAGKTTTFRMLCGLLPATSGQLEVAGMNLRTARAQARGRIGYVAQKFSLYGNLSVRENLQFFGGAYGLRGRELQRRVQDSIERFELPANAASGLLPGGYKQRLAMAAGLIHQPQILFLDEPTSGIDPLARRAFWRTITTLAASGVTIIITTHFMEEAEYCDRIAIQDAGRMLALGTPRQVRQQAGSQGGDMNSAFIAIVEQGRATSAARPASA